jgi:asparaginyl-tRNA synthetase
MKRIFVKELFHGYEEYFDDTVKLSGWMKTIRDSKTILFLELNDGSFFKNVQIIVESDFEDFEKVRKLSIPSGITVEGIVVPAPSGKQSFEIKATKILVEGTSVPEYPLQKKRHSFEYLRTIPHLRPRTNTFSAVFRMRSVLAYAIHKFFQERGFVYVHSPIITGSDCEGAGQMFRVTTLDLENLPKGEEGNVLYDRDFFKKEARLTVSGQLQGEAYSLAFGNIYTFGPTFRAEKSSTLRHAAEFWMIEPEIAFADIHDDMDLAEDMIKYIIRYCMEELPEEMEFFNTFVDKELIAKLQNILNSDFERITYTQAVEILLQSGETFEFPVEWGLELQTEHEKYLTEKVYKKPVFVIDYPKNVKSFYMRVNDDNKTVAAMDLLVPGVGELIGGSQREERSDILESRIKDMGMELEDYEWYMELRKFGGVKHAGFGLGFERCLMYLTGISNIRDVISFPRTYGTSDI